MFSKSAVRWLKAGLQIGVSLGLLAWVFRKIDLQQVKALLLQDGGGGWLLGALALFNLSKIASAWRLNVYQRGVSIALSEWENLRLYYAGMFLNLCLPGGIGGDGYKIVVLQRAYQLPLKTLVGITLLDRVSGLLVLLLLLCLLLPGIGLTRYADWLGVGVPAGAVAFVSVFVWLHRRYTALSARNIGVVFCYGLAVQLLQLACVTCLLMHVQAPPEHTFAYLCIFLVSSVAAVVPLSIGGLGVREITFLYGLTLLQLVPTYGVAASSSFFLVTALSSLLGVVFLKGLPKAQPTSS